MANLHMMDYPLQNNIVLGQFSIRNIYQLLQAETDYCIEFLFLIRESSNVDYEFYTFLQDSKFIMGFLSITLVINAQSVPR